MMGNGGVSLTASAQSSIPNAIQQGKLYQISRKPSLLNNDKTTFTIEDTDDDIMVRVVGKISSSNAVLLFSAKKLESGGNISIQVCNTSLLWSYDRIQFQVYGINNANIGHTFKLG